MAKRKAKRDPQKDEELPDAPPAKDEKQKNEEDESDEVRQSQILPANK